MQIRRRLKSSVRVLHPNNIQKIFVAYFIFKIHGIHSFIGIGKSL